MRRHWWIIAAVLVLTGAVCVFSQPGATESPATAAELGLLLLEKDGSLYVLGVNDDSIAQEAGMLPGDVLISTDGQRLQSVSILEDILNRHLAEKRLPVMIQRLNRELLIDLRWR